jgi:hypothetical protein
MDITTGKSNSTFSHLGYYYYVTALCVRMRMHLEHGTCVCSGAHFCKKIPYLIAKVYIRRYYLVDIRIMCVCL